MFEQYIKWMGKLGKKLYRIQRCVGLILEYIKPINIKKTNKITLLNTQMGSVNLGDDIIMYYTKCALKPLLDVFDVYEVATHLPPSKRDIDYMLSSKAVIACGTDFIKTDLENTNWVFNDKMIHMKNFILFSAGSWATTWATDKNYSFYSKIVWNILLRNGWFHSVRESSTYYELIDKWKIPNVLNTGCVTIFGSRLDEICKEIPVQKANNVIFTVNWGYKDAEMDYFLFCLCKELYDKVYFWPQEKYDLEWMRSICDLQGVIIVEQTLDAYNKILAMEDLDYVGSRLHGGIHAMAHKKRSLIIAVDNRAVAFHKDANIPIIHKECVKNCLREKILSSWETKININYESIKEWFAYMNKKLNG